MSCVHHANPSPITFAAIAVRLYSRKLAKATLHTVPLEEQMAILRFNMIEYSSAATVMLRRSFRHILEISRFVL